MSELENQSINITMPFGRQQIRECPFETDRISCQNCGGRVNVYPLPPTETEVHCDECGAHYLITSGQ